MSWPAFPDAVRPPAESERHGERHSGHLLQAMRRKHLIAGEYLATHEAGTGVLLALAAKARRGVPEIRRRNPAASSATSRRRRRAPASARSTSLTPAGPGDDQDVRAPAVSRSGHPQRLPVRRGRRARGLVCGRRAAGDGDDPLEHRLTPRWRTTWWSSGSFVAAGGSARLRTITLQPSLRWLRRQVHM